MRKYTWYFGDGERSSEQSPEHIYYMPGIYYGRVDIVGDYGEDLYYTFVVRVYDWDYTNEEEGPNASFPNKCYRVALKSSQGVGIVSWGIGGDMPIPEAFVGVVKSFTKGNIPISLILDNFSGLFYRIGVKEIWKDKVNEYGEGKNINGLIRLKEHTGKHGEDVMIEHVESHIHMRPQDEYYKGQSGFTDKGFLEGFSVNLKMFSNGNTNTPVGELKNVQQYGDYIFGKRIEDKRLQLQIETTASAFRITKIKQFLLNIDKVTPDLLGGTRIEDDLQSNFSNMDLWITRDSKFPLMNRATGNNVTGSYNSLVQGPDENNNSALYFGVTDTLTETLSQIGFPSSLTFWIADMSAGGDLFLFNTAGANNFIIRIVTPGIYIRLTNDAGWTQDVLLEWSGVGWVYIAIVIDTVNIYVYENGVLKGIILVPGWLPSYGGTIAMIGTSIISIFDIRRVKEKLSSSSIQWYYNDIINYNGDGGVLPLMR